jgi:hypothetical protein
MTAMDDASPGLLSRNAAEMAVEPDMSPSPAIAEAQVAAQLVGSDRAMIEMITAPKQPLHQRVERELLVPPLNPAPLIGGGRYEDNDM